VARAWHKISDAKQQSGLAGATSATAGLARNAGGALRRRAREVLIDLRLGARTRGTVRNEAALEHLSIGGDPQPYEPVHLVWWRQLVPSLPLVLGNSTFVDLGAGRGRAMILAAQAGFDRVLGVELDAQLAAEAETNLRRWASRRWRGRGPREVRVVRGDAATFPLPHGPLAVCIYNAFGTETLRRILTQVCARQDEAVVAYFNPVHADVFDGFPLLTVHARGDGWALYRRARLE
jgi:hypothetical protein